MIAPRAPSAFVCLRCEAQIAPRRLPAFPRRTSHAKFSASARRRDGTEDAETLPQEQEHQVKITKQVQPLNRLRKRKGQVIRETSATLGGGLKQLGADADVLVLKEFTGQVREIKEQEPEIIEPPEPIEVPDIAASLQQEGKIVTPEDIYQQIESLRPEPDDELQPSEAQFIKQSRFLKLKKTLMSGFTQQQLIRFLSIAKKTGHKKVCKGVLASIQQAQSESKLSIEQSEWQPGQTSITQRLPGVDRHIKVTGHKKSVSKQLLVDRILRDAWNLVLLEEIETPGELECFLKPWQLTLLTAGENETMLDKIGRTRRVRLEIYKPHDVLRITADKSTAEYAAYDIEKALKNSESKRMDLNSYEALLVEGAIPSNKEFGFGSIFAQDDIDVVSALTRTSIEIDKKTMLIIRGFDLSAVEEARRILINFLPLKDPTTRTFDMPNLGAAKNLTYLMPVFPEDKSLDHKYRKIKAGRMSLPAVRTSEPEIIDDQANPESSARITALPKRVMQGLLNRTLANLRRSAADATEHTETVGDWSPEASYSLSAGFGQALFPLEFPNAKMAMKAASQQYSRSYFSRSFPGLSSLLASPELSATGRLKTPSLIYNLRPAPEQSNFEPDQMFPHVRIQMRTTLRGVRAHLHQLSLGFQQSSHDVLFPNKVADIRFYRSGGLNFDKSHQDKNVAEWTKAVIKNIESGSRLTAPPLRLDIPKWTIPGFATDDKGTRSVLYHLSDIQFRQSVSADLFGENVSYSTVQSGKLRTKGGAFKAHYTGHGDSQLLDEVAIKAFVERCFNMVNLITDMSMNTSPVSRQLRPRHETWGRREKRNEAFASVPDPVAGNTDDRIPLQGVIDRIARYPEQSGALADDESREEVQVEKMPASEEQSANEEVQPVVEENALDTEASNIPQADEAQPTTEPGTAEGHKA